MEAIIEDIRLGSGDLKQKIEISPDIIGRIKDADHIILSGASCAGKSTFLEVLQKSHGDLFSMHQCVLPKEWCARGMISLPSKTLFHINMIRSVGVRMGQHPTYLYSNTAAPVEYSEFVLDPVIARFCKMKTGKTVAIVLLTPQKELINRTLQRALEEPKLEENTNSYDRNLWSWAARLHNIEATLKNWVRFLTDNGVAIIFVESTNGKFSLLADEKVALAKVACQEFKLSENEAKQVWTYEPFESQRVSNLVAGNLPGDCSRTSKVIFKDSVNGCSVLDIGSADGYFCFEAEKAGAQKVVGVELDGTRYRQSLLARQLIGSNVEFRQTNLYDMDTEEKFDVVLFLNVIHHLHDPGRALDILGRMTTKRLYIEFPALVSPKFPTAVTLGSWRKILHCFPFIGVNREDEAQQTFVFTRSAIKRMLMNNQRLFSRIEFVESSMASHVIAICHK